MNSDDHHVLDLEELVSVPLDPPPPPLIEGLSEDNSHPVQQAWIAEQVPQCGYCQSGQILTAVALLNRNTKPDEQTVNRTMNVLCRCGTYPRIRKAITKAGEIMEKQNA